MRPASGCPRTVGRAVPGRRHRRQKASGLPSAARSSSGRQSAAAQASARCTTRPAFTTQQRMPDTDVPAEVRRRPRAPQHEVGRHARREPPHVAEPERPCAPRRGRHQRLVRREPFSRQASESRQPRRFRSWPCQGSRWWRAPPSPPRPPAAARERSDAPGPRAWRWGAAPPPRHPGPGLRSRRRSRARGDRPTTRPTSAARAAAPSSASWSAWSRGTSPRASPASSTRRASSRPKAVGATKASQKAASQSSATAGRSSSSTSRSHPSRPPLPSGGTAWSGSTVGTTVISPAIARASSRDHPQHAQLLRNGEAVAALHLDGRHSLCDEPPRPGDRSPQEFLVRRCPRGPRRGQDAAAPTGDVRVGPASRHLGELRLTLPPVPEDEMGVAVHETRRDQPPPGVDLQRGRQIEQRLGRAIRADPVDVAVADHQGRIVEHPRVGRSPVAGGERRAPHRERDRRPVRVHGILTPRSRATASASG